MSQAAVDAALNVRVSLVADRMRIGAGAALAYAPDDLAAVLTAELAARAAATAAGQVVDLDSRRPQPPPLR